MKLHSFCQSGNSYKVAFFLAHLGLSWEPVFVDFMKGATRDPAWQAHLNPMGEAPVLTLDNGQQLTQSGAILTWLATEYAPQFLGSNPMQRYEVLRWLLFDNHKFTNFLATYRFLRSFSPTAPDAAVLNWLKGRVKNAYNITNAHLKQHPFVAGDQLTIADFSMAGYIFYPSSETGIDLAKDYEHLAAWADRMRALKGWQDPYELLPGERLPPKWIDA